MKRGASSPMPARRGRPSRQQAEAIDRQILDCARACFLDSGFAGTTMDGVAERAGVTRATLYLRHADKEALLRAVVEDQLATWSRISAETDWMLGPTTDQRLRHYARTMLRWSCDPEVREFHRLLEIESGPGNSHAELQRMFRAPMLDILAGEIARDGEERGCGIEDPHRLAAMFLGMLSTGLTSSGTPDDAALDRFADHAVAVFTGGRSGW